MSFLNTKWWGTEEVFLEQDCGNSTWKEDVPCSVQSCLDEDDLGRSIPTVGTAVPELRWEETQVSHLATCQRQSFNYSLLLGWKWVSKWVGNKHRGQGRDSGSMGGASKQPHEEFQIGYSPYLSCCHVGNEIISKAGQAQVRCCPLLWFQVTLENWKRQETSRSKLPPTLPQSWFWDLS